jgi:hypothetical protein
MPRLSSDGTNLVVFAKIDGTELPIGRIQMTLRSGLLEINSKAHISPVFPLRDVQEIWVTEGGRTILTVSLNRLSDQ